MSVCLPGVRGMQRDKDGKWRSEAPVRATLTIRLSEEDKQALINIAEQRGTSATVLAREIVAEWLQQQEEAQSKKRAA